MSGSLADPTVWAAIVVALAAACGFAVSTSLEHRVAGEAPPGRHGGSQVMRYVLRQPLWLAGAATGLVSFGLHALALKLGAIAVVQPVMVAGVVLAIPVRAALDHRRPEPRELRAVSVAALGLAAFLVVADTERASGVPDGTPALALTLGGVAVTGILAGIATRLRDPRARAFVFGAAAGVLFGLTAGLVKMVVGELDRGLVDVVTSWPLWALVVVGPLGVAVNQHAYHVAPLSASMPMVNVVDVLVALGFGWVVFGEAPSRGAVSLTIQAAALACIVVGLRLIAKSLHDHAVTRHPTADTCGARS